MGFFSSILGIAAPIIGGVLGGQSSKKAADTQAGAANQATQLQRDMWEKQLELQSPFRDAGLTSQNRLMDYLGLSANTGQAGYGKYGRDPTMADLQLDPGYAFRMGEGIKALDRSAAARGGLLSGGHMKGIQQFGQDMASQEYQNAFNRYNVNRQNQINPLQAFLGQGQSSTNALGQAGQNYASNAGQGIMAAGEARAAGTMGQFNSGIGALSGLNDYMGQKTLMNSFNDYYARQDPAISSSLEG